jgi:hypothetical protein
MVQVDVTGELNGRIRVAGQLADRFQFILLASVHGCRGRRSRSKASQERRLDLAQGATANPKSAI